MMYHDDDDKKRYVITSKINKKKVGEVNWAEVEASPLLGQIYQLCGLSCEMTKRALEKIKAVEQAKKVTPFFRFMTNCVALSVERNALPLPLNSTLTVTTTTALIYISKLLCLIVPLCIHNPYTWIHNTLY